MCPKCHSAKIELVRYRKGQQRVVIRCRACRSESVVDAVVLGLELKRMMQSYYDTKRQKSERHPRGCGGCGR